MCLFEAEEVNRYTKKLINYWWESVQNYQKKGGGIMQYLALDCRWQHCTTKRECVLLWEINKEIKSLL